MNFWYTCLVGVVVRGEARGRGGEGGKSSVNLGVSILQLKRIN